MNYPFLNEYSHDLARLKADAAYREVLDDVKPRWEAVITWERTRREGRASLRT